jgi:hypothetical protein
LSWEPRDFNSPEYKRWRKAVYVRDKYRCQMPGCSGTCKQLNAHHIQRWADLPALRFVVSNGITLCRLCHDSIKDREAEYGSVFAALVANKGGNAALKLLLLKYAKPKED